MTSESKTLEPSSPPRREALAPVSKRFFFSWRRAAAVTAASPGARGNAAKGKEGREEIFWQRGPGFEAFWREMTCKIRREDFRPLHFD